MPNLYVAFQSRRMKFKSRNLADIALNEHHSQSTTCCIHDVERSRINTKEFSVVWMIKCEV